MTYSSLSIANQFLHIAKAKGEDITLMKLQILVYYAHGWYVGMTGKRLINEEIKAKKRGVYIYFLYDAFIKYGSSPIKEQAIEFVGSKAAGFNFINVPTPASAAIKKHIKNVWNAYGKFTDCALFEMAHAVDRPWDKTIKNSETISRQIPFELIKSHFKKATENLKNYENN